MHFYPVCLLIRLNSPQSVTFCGLHQVIVQTGRLSSSSRCCPEVEVLCFSRFPVKCLCFALNASCSMRPPFPLFGQALTCHRQRLVAHLICAMQPRFGKSGYLRGAP